MRRLVIPLYVGFTLSSVYAKDDGAFLDSAYRNLIHPIRRLKNSEDSEGKELPFSNTKEVISYQSPVRSQSARGTCSIFAATSYIEGQLIRKGHNASIDLSEEWLQYIADRKEIIDGSHSWRNFAAIQQYGMASEESFPYSGENWLQDNTKLKEKKCGKLLEPLKTSCFIVHRDPGLLDLTDDQILQLNGDKEFINARKEALEFKTNNLKFADSNFFVTSVEDVKAQLQAGTPVVLEVEFFYGAWSHAKADEIGIHRSLSNWDKGIVTYPEEGSEDKIKSRQHPSGHAVLVVGYDENQVVEAKVKMADGSTKKVTYKGVYYFKNSWGTSGFGQRFKIDGQKHAGYGMMVAKYAEEFGQFYKLNLL